MRLYFRIWGFHKGYLRKNSHVYPWVIKPTDSNYQYYHNDNNYYLSFLSEPVGTRRTMSWVDYKLRKLS